MNISLVHVYWWARLKLKNWHPMKTRRVCMVLAIPFFMSEYAENFPIFFLHVALEFLNKCIITFKFCGWKKIIIPLRWWNSFIFAATVMIWEDLVWNVSLHDKGESSKEPVLKVTSIFENHFEGKIQLECKLPA